LTLTDCLDANEDAHGERNPFPMCIGGVALNRTEKRLKVEDELYAD